ncbi:MAG: sugar kinase [Clostridiales bacterium]|nr:sugar kinase [Clostridiales bacterium]
MDHRFTNGIHKVVIIKKKTRLEELVARFNTVDQAEFYVEHMGADFRDYRDEHDNYYKALEAVRNDAKLFARVQEIDNEYIPNMIFGEKDIVITLGQDGLVVNAMKYLNGQPLIGVNSDPLRWNGDLSVFHPDEMRDVIPAVIGNTYRSTDITMAKACTKDGQELYAVNDFFVGVEDHTSARYKISFGEKTENQSSSGIIISTPLGFGGWHKSVLAQFRGMARAFGLGEIKEKPVGWYEQELIYQVREPFPSVSTRADLVYGSIAGGEKLKVVSNMPEKGIVFSDGVPEDSIEFRSGMEVTIEVADRKGKLVRS